MNIWQDIAVPIRIKSWHIHKIGKRVHRDFTNDYGDVPVATFNDTTKQFEAVVNTRGRAYAARKRLKYRKRKGEVYERVLSTRLI